MTHKFGHGNVLLDGPETGDRLANSLNRRCSQIDIPNAVLRYDYQRDIHVEMSEIMYLCRLVAQHVRDIEKLRSGIPRSRHNRPIEAIGRK